MTTRTVSRKRSTALYPITAHIITPEQHPNPQQFLDKVLSAGVFIAECAGTLLNRRDTAKIVHVLESQIHELIMRPYYSKEKWILDDKQYMQISEQEPPPRFDTVDTDFNPYHPSESPSTPEEQQLKQIIDNLFQNQSHERILQHVNRPESQNRRSFDTVPLSIESLAKIWSGTADTAVAHEVHDTNVFGFYTIVCSIQIQCIEQGVSITFNLYSDSHEQEEHALSYVPDLYLYDSGLSKRNYRQRLVKGTGPNLTDNEWANNIAELDMYLDAEESKRKMIEMNGARIRYDGNDYFPADLASDPSIDSDNGGFSCHALLSGCCINNPFYTFSECASLLQFPGRILLLCYKSQRYAYAEKLRDVVSDVNYSTLEHTLGPEHESVYDVSETQLGDLVLGGKKSALKHLKAKLRGTRAKRRRIEERGILKLSETFVERYREHLHDSNSNINIDDVEKEFAWIAEQQQDLGETACLIARAKTAFMNKWISNSNSGMDFWDVYNIILDTFVVRNRGPDIGIPVWIGGVQYLGRLSDAGNVEILPTKSSRISGVTAEAASAVIRTFTGVETKNVIRALHLEHEFPMARRKDAALLRILSGYGVNFQDGGNCLSDAFSKSGGPVVERQPTLTDCVRMGMKLLRIDGNGVALAYARSPLHELWAYDQSSLTLKTFHEHVSTKCNSIDADIMHMEIACLSNEERLSREFVSEMNRLLENGVHLDDEHLGAVGADFDPHSDVEYIVQSMARYGAESAYMTRQGVNGDSMYGIETLVAAANRVLECGKFRAISHNDRRLTFERVSVGRLGER